MLKILFLILFGIAVFGLAQKMARKDGKSIWVDAAGKRGLRDLFLDEGDEYLLKALFILGVPLGILYLIYKTVTGV